MTGILNATLEVIRSHRVHAAAYRPIATQVGVPLGSMTYSFPDLDGLTVTEFETLRSELEPWFAAPLRDASMIEAVVEVLMSGTVGATSPSATDLRASTSSSPTTQHAAAAPLTSSAPSQKIRSHCSEAVSPTPPHAPSTR
jgi:DNA-binding transcriptional regulator YbjK